MGNSQRPSAVHNSYENVLKLPVMFQICEDLDDNSVF